MIAAISPYGTALIAAGGAIVGGILTSGSSLLIERSRGNREKKANAAREEADLREAGRLVLEELAEIDSALQQAIRTGFTWPADRQLPAFAWREHRTVLARHLPLPSWRWVGAAYTSANEANWHVSQLQREATDAAVNAAVHFVDKEWLREPLRTVRQAMAEVDNLIGPRAGAFTYTGHVGIDELEAELFGDEPERSGNDRATEDNDSGL
jgi:hypothetical protein